MEKFHPYSVVVPGNFPSKDGKGPSLYCAVIVKTVDEKTRIKSLMIYLEINEKL